MDFIPKYCKKDLNANKSNINKSNINETNINETNNNSDNDILKELNNEKKKNERLIENISLLKKELEFEKQRNILLTNKLMDVINKKNNESNEKVKSLELNLERKTIELNKLKMDSNNLNDKKYIDLNKNEDIIAIAFTAVGYKFIYALPCKITDKFARLEEKLFEEYPQYKEVEPFFTVNGKKILRYKTLEENGIKCSDAILLNEIE